MKQRLYDQDKLVLFIGGPRHRALQELIDHNIPLSCVFVPDIENPRLSTCIEISLKNNIPIKKISKTQLTEKIPEIQENPCLSLGFSYLFPKEFLEQTRFVINVHGTLLPKYRGACTLNWVIENGDTQSGVTIHFIDENCDTGDIILQESFDLSIFETGRSLYRKTLEFEPLVLIKALKMLYQGEFEIHSQKDFLVTQYANRKPYHSEVDPNQSLINLYNKIRAADPDKYPAYFYINGEKICIKLWRENKPIDEMDLI